MTYENIKTKFLIEYDKANVTSSYPSLTDYEIAVILDKAYLALLALKLTGNNPRLIPFEGDIKAIEDVRPLIKTAELPASTKYENGVKNATYCTIPDDFLYFLSALVLYSDNEMRTTVLVSHENAKKFFLTKTNLPWIRNCVVFIEGDKIVFVYDPYQKKTPESANVTYLSSPEKFVSGESFNTKAEFALNDTMAEELVNLAIIMAAESVESPRLTTKVQTRPLES